jgi:hypothetical protein
MNTKLARSVLNSATIACVVAGCTWTRFDDITDNPPVERFDAPNGSSGAGQSLATFPNSAGVTLAVTSQNSLVLYDLGSGVEPSRDALTTQNCAGDSSCVLTQQLVGLSASPMTENMGCVAYGLGTSDPGTATAAGNALLICENLKLRTLAVPSSFSAWLMTHEISSKTVVSMATTRRSSPQPLALSVPDARAVWFYDGVSPDPIELPALPDGNVAARSLAVLRDDAGYLVMAGSVTPDQLVWLYRVAADRTASLAGCVAGPAQFGRLLATGNFDGDALDDLAAADEQSVVVLKGSILTALAQIPGDSCAQLDSLERIGQAQCTQLPDLNGCAGTPYAMSLASGNLDATGPDELVLGAPNTSVRGEGAAGAAFIYAASSDALRIVQGLYVSTASGGNWLGKSVAIAQLGGIDTVMAGAPGDNAVMTFYCNSLMPAESRSARCH